MYGYKIVDGKVIVDEQEAAVVINIFNGYLSGMSLRDAAVNAGRSMVHSRVKRIISNFCYEFIVNIVKCAEESFVFGIFLSHTTIPSFSSLSLSLSRRRLSKDFVRLSV